MNFCVFFFENRIVGLLGPFVQAAGRMARVAQALTDCLPASPPRRRGLPTAGCEPMPLLLTSA
jgi:hypothetical protein